MMAFNKTYKELNSVYVLGRACSICPMIQNAINQIFHSRDSDTFHPLGKSDPKSIANHLFRYPYQKTTSCRVAYQGNDTPYPFVVDLSLVRETSYVWLQVYTKNGNSHSFGYQHLKIGSFLDGQSKGVSTLLTLLLLAKMRMNDFTVPSVPEEGIEPKDKYTLPPMLYDEEP